MKALNSTQALLTATLSSIIVTLVSVSSLAAGGVGNTGGGSMCEAQIKIIRDDLAGWISKGGAGDLQLPRGLTADAYAKKMQLAFAAAKIRCVSEGDKGYPVEVYGTPKTCRFDGDSSGALITCDETKFEKLNETKQYELVHHEYAGIANIEIPNRDDSDYTASNQISAYLEDTVVKRLAVKSVNDGTTQIPEDRLAIYRERFEKNLLFGMNGTCKVTKGVHNTVGMDESAILQASMAETASDATKGTIRIIDGQATVTLWNERAWQDDINWTGVTIKLSADMQRINSAVYEHKRYSRKLSSGDLLNPTFRSGWETRASAACTRRK